MKKPHARRRSFAFFAMFGLGATAFLGVGVAALELYSESHGGSLFNLQAGSPAPRFEWKSVDKKHWQAVSTTPSEPTDTTDAREGNRGACPPGMVDVVGKFKLDAQGRESSGEIEELQNSACVDWVNKDFPARCKTFDRDGWLSLSQKLPTKPMHYCIDRFEYPNRAGENPMIVVTYNESAALCKASGKRLCTESEWTFACEGEEAVPYPYGYGRDAEACVVDRPWKPFVENGLAPRDGKKAREELDRLWQGTPSGSHPKCKSPFGVYDLTGNVDEWTKTARTGGYASVLKGGYWGPVRARCRPSTRAHNEDFVAYQQSFRCCSDAPAGASTPSPAPSGSAAPSPTPSADLETRTGTPKLADPSRDVADEDDELDELAKKEGAAGAPKVGVGCSFGPGSGEGTSAFLLVAAASVIAVRTSRRRRS